MYSDVVTALPPSRPAQVRALDHARRSSTREPGYVARVGLGLFWRPLKRQQQARAHARGVVGVWVAVSLASLLVARHTRGVRGRAPTCGWAATARLAIARAALRMHLRVRSCHAKP